MKQESTYQEPVFSAKQQRALALAVQQSVNWFLVEESGSDMPDNMVDVSNYDFKVSPVRKNQFTISAREFGERSYVKLATVNIEHH